MLDGAAKAVPVRQRNAVQDTRRGIAQIQQYNAEAACMQEEVRSANRVFGIASGTNPEKAIELDPGALGGNRIKAVV